MRAAANPNVVLKPVRKLAALLRVGERDRLRRGRLPAPVAGDGEGVGSEGASVDRQEERCLIHERARVVAPARSADQRPSREDRWTPHMIASETDELCIRRAITYGRRIRGRARGPPRSLPASPTHHRSNARSSRGVAERAGGRLFGATPARDVCPLNRHVFFRHRPRWSSFARALHPFVHEVLALMTAPKRASPLRGRVR